MVLHQVQHTTGARMHNLPGLVIEFLRFIRRRYSEHTHIGYERALRLFSAYAPVDYEDICPEIIERFLQSLSLGTNSINTTITGLKSFCRYCEEYHDLPNPTVKVKYLKPKPSRQRILSVKELQQILDVCKDGERAIILFLANTGLRIGEMKALTMECVSPNGRLLYVIGKSNKQRAVPLNKVAKANLLNAINFSKSCKKLYNICQQLSKRAGIRPFSPHSLRHYYATQMSQHVNIYLLSKCLGHSSVTITEKVYIHITDTEMQGLSDCLDRPAESD